MYKIMIIEDDIDFINSLEGFFMTEKKYEIDGYIDSKPALDKLRNGEHYDLILIDYFLKNETGEKVVKRIRLINPNIFICFLTAYSDRLTPQKAFDFGVQGYIEKSGHFSNMINSIKSIVHSSEKAQEFLKKDPKKLFSQRLKVLRQKSNLSQSELAKKLGLTRTAVSNYEMGKAEPTFTVLSNMATIFNTSTDYLIGRIT
jgi:DNA-binding NarL/FixJ family response regulator